MGDPANAASHLRSTLPEAWNKRLDLTRLRRVSGSFVDATLQWRHSDLLFAAPYTAGGDSGDDEQDVLVYILVEHQSSTDPLMPFRLLHYLVRIWDQHLQENPAANRLPVILPLVVHHNRRPWCGPTQLRELLLPDLTSQDDTDTTTYLPSFEFLLDDLARADPETLRSRALTARARVGLWLLKTASGNTRMDEDLEDVSRDLMAILRQPGGFDFIVMSITYIENVADTPSDNMHAAFTRLGTEAEEAYMTTADMLRDEGRAEGRAETLRHLLTHKFGPLPRAAVDRVNNATTEQLNTWTGQILTAATLDEALR